MSNMPKTGKTRYDVLDAFKVVRKYRPNAASISIKVYKPKDKI